MRAGTKLGIGLLLLAMVLGPMALSPVSRAAAPAAPAWRLTVVPLPTNFAPGASGTTAVGPAYFLVATNIGGAPTSGPIILNATMPEGITPTFAGPDDNDPDFASLSCAPPVGQKVTCTSVGPLHPGRWLGSEVEVDVDAGLAGETVSPNATVSGGGATPVSAVSPTLVSDQLPSFGFQPGAASLFTNADGSPATQAGSHPDQLTVDFGLPSFAVGDSLLTGAGHVRNVHSELPPGVVINPNATPVRCTEAELISESRPGCPTDSQIGIVTIMTDTPSPAPQHARLFNMVPPAGVPGEIAFNAVEIGAFVHLTGSLRSDGDYGISADANDLIALPGQPVLSTQVQIWGDPSGVGHNQIRGECNFTGGSCPVERQDTPLLTMPSACSGPLLTKLRANSWEEPGAFVNVELASQDVAGAPVDVTGCSLLGFKPTLTLRPDVSAAETPTGAHIALHVPQSKGVDHLATANLKDAKVTLPEGLVVNSASAGGLDACSPAQVGLLGTGFSPPHRIRFSDEPAQCPPGSKVGSLEVRTPVLDHPLAGSVYVAKPFENPFGTLLAVYLAVEDPQTGVVAKLAGKVQADPVTGQLTTTFEENPQLPIEDVTVDLFGGPRGALRTPSTCNSFGTEGELAPWSGKPAVPTSDSFAIDRGPGGLPCVTDEAQAPNTPEFKAGTETPLAASYSPFVLRLHRADGTQQFKVLNLTLPPGLSGKLTGTATCSDAAFDAAASRSGAAELASPSCPAASQLGEVDVGAGAGSQPYYTAGKVFLAGPYKGAPLSGAIVVPAVAGPFDLGTVVVRVALYVDRSSARLRVKSDPAPHILQGIPLDVRDIQVHMNRPEFTLNPTSCSRMSIAAEEVSLFDQVASLGERFQAAGCRALDFKPNLRLRLRGGMRRAAHPSIRATLTAKPGEANVSRVSVALPDSEFLDQAHIRTICTRVQFAAGQCPAGSVYGHVKATTPLLDEALEGPVYLRSSSHKLPDAVAVLRGPASRPIEIEFAARVDSIHGGIRTTIDSAPDAPVKKVVLTMQGGKKGLLINSRNLCAATNRATVELDGQNGKTHDFNPVMETSCARARPGGGKSKRR